MSRRVGPAPLDLEAKDTNRHARRAGCAAVSAAKAAAISRPEIESWRPQGLYDKDGTTAVVVECSYSKASATGNDSVTHAEAACGTSISREASVLPYFEANEVTVAMDPERIRAASEPEVMTTINSSDNDFLEQLVCVETLVPEIDPMWERALNKASNRGGHVLALRLGCCLCCPRPRTPSHIGGFPAQKEIAKPVPRKGSPLDRTRSCQACGFTRTEAGHLHGCRGWVIQHGNKQHQHKLARFFTESTALLEVKHDGAIEGVTGDKDESNEKVPQIPSLRGRRRLSRPPDRDGKESSNMEDERYSGGGAYLVVPNMDCAQSSNCPGMRWCREGRIVPILAAPYTSKAKVNTIQTFTIPSTYRKKVGIERTHTIPHRHRVCLNGEVFPEALPRSQAILATLSNTRLEIEEEFARRDQERPRLQIMEVIRPHGLWTPRANLENLTNPPTPHAGRKPEKNTRRNRSRRGGKKLYQKRLRRERRKDAEEQLLLHALPVKADTAAQVDRQVSNVGTGGYTISNNTISNSTDPRNKGFDIEKAFTVATPKEGSKFNAEYFAGTDFPHLQEARKEDDSACTQARVLNIVTKQVKPKPPVEDESHNQSWTLEHLERCYREVSRPSSQSVRRQKVYSSPKDLQHRSSWRDKQVEDGDKTSKGKLRDGSPCSRWLRDRRILALGSAYVRRSEEDDHRNWMADLRGQAERRYSQQMMETTQKAHREHRDRFWRMSTESPTLTFKYKYKEGLNKEPTKAQQRPWRSIERALTVQTTPTYEEWEALISELKERTAKICMIRSKGPKQLTREKRKEDTRAKASQAKIALRRADLERRVLETIRDLPNDHFQRATIIEKLPKELSRMVILELMERSIRKTNAMQARKSNRTRGFTLSKRESDILEEEIKSEVAYLNSFNNKGDHRSSARPQDTQKLSVADRILYYREAATAAASMYDKDDLSNCIFMIRHLVKQQNEEDLEIYAKERGERSESDDDDKPEARVNRLQPGVLSEPWCALVDSGANISVSGDKDFFSDECAFDPSLPTASSAIEGEKGKLGHCHAEWLMTSFIDPRGGGVKLRVPILWRYEPSMGKDNGIILSPGVFTKALPLSRAVLAGTEEAACPSAGVWQTGIYLNDEKGNTLVHIPLLGKKRSDYACIRVEPMSKETRPKDPQGLGIDLSSITREPARVRSLYNPEPVAIGTVGRLGALKPSASPIEEKVSDGEIRGEPVTGTIPLETSEEEDEHLKCRQSRGAVKVGAYAFWHSALNHRPKLTILKSVLHAVGAKIGNHKDTEICVSCLEGRGKMLNKQKAKMGSSIVKGLESFLAEGCAQGLSAAQIREVQEVTIAKLKEMSPEMQDKRGATDIKPEIRVREGIDAPMSRLFCDLIGPYKSHKPGGRKFYIAVICCRLTHYTWAYYLEKKSDAISVIRLISLEAQSLRLRIDSITTDCAGEHRNPEWMAECARHGIRAESLLPRSQWGSFVERQIQTLLGDWRCHIVHAKLPVTIYAWHLFEGTVWINNKIATKSLGWKSPHYYLFGTRPDLSNIQILGSTAYILRPNSLLPGGADYTTKLGPRAVEGIIVGFTESRGVKVRRLDGKGLVETAQIAVEDRTKPRKLAPMQHRIDKDVGSVAQASGVYGSLEHFARDGRIEDDSAIGVLGQNGAWDMYNRAEGVSPEILMREDDSDDDYSDEDEDMPRGGGDERMSAQSLQREVMGNLPSPQQLRRQDREGAGPRRDEGFHIREDLDRHVDFDQGEEKQEEGKLDLPEVPEIRRSQRAGRGVREIPNVTEEYASTPNAAVEGVAPKGIINALQTEDDVEPYFCLVQEGEVIEGEWDFTFEETKDCNLLLEIGSDDRIKTVVGRMSETGQSHRPPEALITPRDSGRHKNHPEYVLGEKLAKNAQDEAQTRDHIEVVRIAKALTTTKDNGLSYSEAIARNKDPHDREMFKQANTKEWVENLLEQEVVVFRRWDEIPPGTKIIPIMTTFSRKRDAKGKITKWKARACLRGDQMTSKEMAPGSRYAPTANLESTRMLMGISNREGMWSGKLDVSGAYLQAPVGALLFAATPAGCATYDNEGRQMFLQVMKNLYGDPTAARRWITLCTRQLEIMGFCRSFQDPCLFRTCVTFEEAERDMKEFKDDPGKDARTPDEEIIYPRPRTAAPTIEEQGPVPEGYDTVQAFLGTMVAEHEYSPDQGSCNGDAPKIGHHLDPRKLICNQPSNHQPGYYYCIISVWVDDMFLVANDERFGKYIMERILNRYPGTCEQYPKEFLGMYLDRSGPDLKLTQQVTIETLLKEGKMGKRQKSKDVPMTAFTVPNKVPLSKADRKAIKEEIDFFRFCGLLGWTRHSHPVVAFAHTQFCRIMSNPDESHVRQANHFLRWLQGQKQAGIIFRSTEDKGCYLMVDTNYEVKTFTGIAVICGGAIIKFLCVQQKFISLSTYEAELAGMSEAIKVALDIQAKLKDTGEKVGRITIFGDNKAAVEELQLSAPEKVAPKARHHRMRLLWAKQIVQLGLVEVKWIRSEDNLADAATKPLGKDLWNSLSPQIMGTAPIEALRGYPTITEKYGPSHATATGGDRKTQ